MKIRKYQHHDRAELIALWQTVFADNPAHSSAETNIDNKIKIDDLIFVAEWEGALVGACMVGYDGHRGWLYAMATHPTYRRQGIGRSLCEFAIAALKDLGCVKVNLQVRANNAEVIGFYRALGFATEERVSMGKLLVDEG